METSGINNYSAYTSYEEIARFRQVPKEMIGMVSEMIATLDHNTIVYMVDEMKETIKEKDEEIRQDKETIKEKDETIKKQDETIKELKEKLKANNIE